MRRCGVQRVADIRCTAPNRAYASAPHRLRKSAVKPVPPPDLTDKDKKDFKKVTHQLVNAAACDEHGGWKPVSTLRGEEHRLMNLLNKAQRRSPVLPDDGHNFDVEHDLDLDFTEVSGEVILDLFKPGSLVELRRNAVTNLAIILGVMYIGRAWHILSFAGYGLARAHIPNDVTYLVPNVASKDLTSRAGLAEVATEKSENMARVELMKRLRSIEHTLTHEYAIVCRLDAAKFYDCVSSTNSEQWASTTVEQATSILFPAKSSSVVTRFAVHRFLMNQPIYFQADPLTYMTTQQFLVRPRSHVRELQTVKKLRLSRSDAIDDFVSKARQIIGANRLRAIQFKDHPPSRTISKSEVWTNDDLLILGLLLHGLRTKRGTQTDPYHTMLASIMKKLEPKKTHVDDGFLHELLVDLAIIPPWFDVSTSKAELGLGPNPDHPFLQVQKQDNIVAYHSKPQALGPEDFYPKDMLESVRHDFGNMPVYIIDDPSAEELDDGVSIETIPSEPLSDWVHVHIADPTAVLHPNHIFARRAREMMESRYFTHGTWPMLPPSLTHDALGLGRPAASGKGERVLTFSFKVNKTGDIVDSDVRAGIVRNLKIVSYDDVDRALGLEPLRLSYPFGGARPTPEPVHLDAVHSANLRALQAVTQRIVAKRLTTTSFSFFIPSAEVVMSPRPLDQTPALSTKPTSFRGFPQLRYQVQASVMSLKRSHGMVAELMKAACRAASIFCRDRGIPAVRRAASSVTIPSEHAFADVLAMRNADGMINYYDALHLGIVAPAAEFVIEPKMHWMMGIPEGEGYVRVTSPLRRFSDLVMHWQIKHALQKPNSRPLYSESDMLELCRELTVFGRMDFSTSQTHKAFWSTMFFKRWLDGYIPRDPNLPNPFEGTEATIFGEAKWNPMMKKAACKVQLTSLAATAVLTDLAFGEQPPLGQKLTVKLSKLRLGMNPMVEVVKA